MGAWIEILWNGICRSDNTSRTLYGCVDWNYIIKKLYVFGFYVAPFMGAWIEIRCGCSRENKKQVAPFMGAWIEINKTDDYLTSNFSRTLYGCVDWNR